LLLCTLCGWLRAGWAVHRGSHTGTGLRPLRGEASGVMTCGAKRRSRRSMRDCVVPLHGHALGRVGLAGERELCLGGGGVFLVQQAYIAWASGRRG
jgi:hypothetical protein